MQSPTSLCSPDDRKPKDRAHDSPSKRPFVRFSPTAGFPGEERRGVREAILEVVKSFARAVSSVEHRNWDPGAGAKRENLAQGSGMPPYISPESAVGAKPKPGAETAQNEDGAAHGRHGIVPGIFARRACPCGRRRSGQLRGLRPG
jgi:hypothetical protein